MFSAAGEKPAEATERPRFGINSLINRMTGNVGDQERSGPAQTPRQQPPVSSQSVQPAPVDSDDDEEDQIEIPAFLRRQAN